MLKHGSSLHILHLTTEDELSLLQSGDLGNKNITAEVCVHHLFFDESAYKEKGNFIKCNPSIKSSSDRLSLLQALKDDKIDIIATDHAPHTFEEKNQHYVDAPAGLPLVQHSLQVLLDFYHQGIFSLEDIVTKTSHNTARRFDIKDRGFLREGYFADIAVVDTEKKYKVTKDNILYLCGWSPFEDHEFKGAVTETVLNGEIVYSNGNFKNHLPIGMQIEFNR